MRQTIVVATTILLLIAGAVSMNGQVTSTTASTTTGIPHPPPDGGPPPPTGGKHKHPAGSAFKGTVASVDATAKSFVVHPAKGDDYTFMVNDKTKYLPKGKTWDDVKVDAKVSVTYHGDGAEKWAETVHIWAPKAAPAAKTGR